MSGDDDEGARFMSASRAWVVPLAFALLFAVVGGSAYRAIEASVRSQVAGQLSTILEADVTALKVWLSDTRAVAEVQADDPEIRRHIEALVRTAESSPDPRDALLASDDRFVISRRLSAVMRGHEYQAFAAFSRRGIVVAGSTAQSASIGRETQLPAELLRSVMESGSRVTQPVLIHTRGEGGQTPGPKQRMLLVLAPVKDGSGKVIGVLGFGLSAGGGFSEILQVARMGESGETYAFDEKGLMLSESRFNDQLLELGLLPAAPAARSSMNIHVRDPGGDMTLGFEPTLPVLSRPLTRMAGAAVTGESGMDTNSYPDYRGVPVVGAWTWVPELEMGIATEIDAAEAYAGLAGLRLRFGLLLGTLLLGTVAMAIFAFVLTRMRSRMDAVQKLGRYHLVRKIGEGGMGAVYLAQHALLRRPTAVKLLRPDKTSDEALSRFQREVQVTSRLTHPNTIAIYDYGHTPAGVFYYAMEYLAGMTVAACVEEDGPQPEARVVRIMKQVCASLAEAHAAGLIHRDLKPANVMLCERGGQVDVVKVLDFGLVRLQDQTESLALTRAEALTGTPLYLSPEAVRSPETIDVRSDLYQLGAIAYYLLVGDHVFPGTNVVEVIGQHLNSEPIPPSERLGRPVSPDLEALILRCLEKEPEDRFADAEELLIAFEECEYEGTWGRVEAQAWWEAWRRDHPGTIEASGSETASSLPSDFALELEDRFLSSSRSS
jgi:aminoglycoside phosphotransferase (APT) family kinase protein